MVQREGALQHGGGVVVRAQTRCHAVSHRVARREVARVALTQKDVRRAHDRRHAVLDRVARGFEVDGELGDGAAELGHHVEVRRRVVIMARERDSLLTGDVGGLLFGYGPVRAYGFAPNFQVAVLPLARGVVHEGQLVDFARAQVTFDLLDEVHVVDFEAQMQAVADEVGVSALGALRVGHERHDLFGVFPPAHGLFVHEVAPVGRKRVEHGGDAVGEQLALGLEHRGREVHENGRARGDDRLDVVGMDVDEAGYDVAAVGVDDADTRFLGVERALLLDCGDGVALDDELVAEQEPVGLDDDAVSDDVHEVRSLSISVAGEARWARFSASSPPCARLPLKQRVDEFLGVGVLGVLHDLVSQPVLDHLAVEHHHGTVGQKPDDAEVVAHDHHRHADFAAQRQNEVEHARLDRQIEAGRHLVQEEHGRAVGKRLGDLHALLHAAREVARRVLFAAKRYVHALEQLAPAAYRVAHVARPRRDLLLGDVGEAGEPHAQSQVRVLVHHTEHLVADAALGLARQLEGVFCSAVEGRDAHIAFGGVLVEVEALHERGFARSRLSYHTQDLAGVHLKRHVAHRVHRAAFGANVALELRAGCQAVGASRAEALGQVTHCE